MWKKFKGALEKSLETGEIGGIINKAFFNYTYLFSVCAHNRGGQRQT